MADETKKFFINKKFFLYTRRAPNISINKTVDLIKVFGGQIEQFLDHEVNYVLTDIPKSEWPPHGRDNILETARNYNVKLMSLPDLLGWCSRYVYSQSSSDDDDELKGKNIIPPFIKFEDKNCHYAPTVKELQSWPELNLSGPLPVGKPLFSDIINGTRTPNQSSNFNRPDNSAQLTQQACARTATPNLNASSSTNPLNPSGAPRVKRRHPIYCEICSQRISDRIEDHMLSQAHKNNTDKLDWSEVSSVIDSLPSLSTLSVRRLAIPHEEVFKHQEFLCLHKVDSVSQLFFNSNKDTFSMISPVTDRKLAVQIN